MIKDHFAEKLEELFLSEDLTDKELREKLLSQFVRTGFGEEELDIPDDVMDEYSKAAEDTLSKVTSYVEAREKMNNKRKIINK